jgi:hypothetical protein
VRPEVTSNHGRHDMHARRSRGHLRDPEHDRHVDWIAATDVSDMRRIVTGMCDLATPSVFGDRREQKGSKTAGTGRRHERPGLRPARTGSGRHQTGPGIRRTPRSGRSDRGVRQVGATSRIARYSNGCSNRAVQYSTHGLDGERAAEINAPPACRPDLKSGRSAVRSRPVSTPWSHMFRRSTPIVAAFGWGRVR